MLAIDQVDLDGVAVDRRAQHGAQFVEDWRKGAAQIVVAVRWEGGRLAASGRQRGQVASQAQAIEVQLARMRHRRGCMLREDGFVAVERLQQQKRGQLRHTVAELSHAAGEHFGALSNQAV